MKRLFTIQQALKCGKESYNQFGKFKYRTTSAILEAVKPYLNELDLIILMSDDVKAVGNREVLIANVELYDANTSQLVVSSSACAEIGQYNGMSIGQATGSSSTYARKYALCGLFAIDDSTDDPDVKNNTLSGMIESATCASDINLLMSQVKAANEEDKKLFNKKVKDLKLEFNKETKKYEQQ
jgi:hypothetical protein